jgi:hypothetical protein
LLVGIDWLAEYGQKVAHRGWNLLGVQLQELFEDRRAVERIGFCDGVRRA